MELQRKTQVLASECASNYRVFIGKEWDPGSWGRDVWKDPTEAENFEPSDSQGFISPGEVVSPPSAEDILLPIFPEILPVPPLTEEMTPSLSAKPAVTFYKGNVK